MATFRVLLTPGDGIGPEVLEESLKVLGRIEKRFKHEFQFEEGVIGGASIDKHGVALRPETVAKAKASAAVLFGAVRPSMLASLARELVPWSSRQPAAVEARPAE